MYTADSDWDMKIAGMTPPKPDGADAAKNWSRQKENGNIDRAHQLGTVLAQQLLTVRDADPAVTLQKQMLFAFAVDAGCPVFLPDELLAQTACGTFFERLRALLPAFEDTLRRLGAFTFYRLCLDNEQEQTLPAEKIGTVFAALCGKAGEADTENTGTELFRGYLRQLEQAVEHAEFQQIR